METSKRSNSRTPSGGVYSIMSYIDENGIACSEEKAYMVVINEYNEKDEVINSTYAYLNH